MDDTSDQRPMRLDAKSGTEAYTRTDWPRLSLRGRLVLLWVFFVFVCVVLGAILSEVYQLGTETQTQQIKKLAQNACELISARYMASAGPASRLPQRDLDLMHVVLEVTLRDTPGIEGGIWNQANGFVAYAFPTYEGSEVKKTVPETERVTIAELSRRTIANASTTSELRPGKRETLVLVACPMDKSGAQAAWTMARVPLVVGKALDRLYQGLGLLFLFVVASGAWLGYAKHRWVSQFDRIERALTGRAADGVSTLVPGGDPDLNRILIALKSYESRLGNAYAESQKLNQSLASAERLATLGRVAAGIAHEVRNPIAAIRLRVENALSRPELAAKSMQAVLEQIDRLEDLVTALLNMTQPIKLNVADVDVKLWLKDRIGNFHRRAAERRIRFSFSTTVEEWRFDPIHLGRALDNVLDNALRHTPADGEIVVTANEAQNKIAITVTDSGSGVPEHLRAQLFEPFVTDRADGTGLGLALVREVMIAHGGSAHLIESAKGASFELELPWPAF